MVHAPLSTTTIDVRFMSTSKGTLASVSCCQRRAWRQVDSEPEADLEEGQHVSR